MNMNEKNIKIKNINKRKIKTHKLNSELAN